MLQLGVRTNAVGSFQDIGFGFVGGELEHHPPAVIAYEQQNAGGETSGDLVFGTRTGTDGTVAATERIRIRNDGSVNVNSVRFTATSLGTNASPTIITLGGGVAAAAVTGTFAVTGDVTVATDKFVVTATNGNTAIAGTLKSAGATTLSSTLGVTGDATYAGDAVFSKSAAVVTHTSATGGLSIVSSHGFVEVEGVRFIGESMGTNGFPDLITFTNGVVNINGTIVHTGTTDHTGDFEVGTDKFQVTATSGDTTVKGTLAVDGDVTVGSGNFVVTASNGDTAIAGTLSAAGATTLSSTLDVSGDVNVNSGNFVVTASSGKATMKGAVEMSMNTATISHTGTSGGLTISSTNNHVAVESVQFAGANIGVSGDTDLIGLASGVMTVNGQVASTTLDTSGAATVGSTLDVTSDLTVGATGEFVVTAADGNTATLGSLGVGTTLGVTGLTTLAAVDVGGDVDIGSGNFVVTAADGNTATLGSLGVGTTLGVTGLTTLAAVDVGGDVDIGSGMFTVAAGDGNTVITGTLSAGATTLSSTLDVTGDVNVNGNIHATGTSTSSDARFKTNVVSIENALDLIRDIRPVTFSFKTTEGYKFPQTRQAGVVAQELEKTLPDLVSTDDNGFKGVAYDRFGVYALAAVKELDEEVRALGAALSALRLVLEQTK